MNNQQLIEDEKDPFVEKMLAKVHEYRASYAYKAEQKKLNELEFNATVMGAIMGFQIGLIVAGLIFTFM